MSVNVYEVRRHQEEKYTLRMHLYIHQVLREKKKWEPLSGKRYRSLRFGQSADERTVHLDRISSSPNYCIICRPHSSILGYTQMSNVKR